MVEPDLTDRVIALVRAIERILCASQHVGRDRVAVWMGGGIEGETSRRARLERRD